MDCEAGLKFKNMQTRPERACKFGVHGMRMGSPDRFKERKR